MNGYRLTGTAPPPDAVSLYLTPEWVEFDTDHRMGWLGVVYVNHIYGYVPDSHRLVLKAASCESWNFKLDTYVTLGWLEPLTAEDAQADRDAVVRNAFEAVAQLDAQGAHDAAQSDPGTKPALSCLPTGELNLETPSSPPECADAQTWFDVWWSLYPRKVDKKRSKAYWERQGLEAQGRALVADLRARLARHWPWLKDDPAIPHPSTFLNGERWKDDIESRPAGWSELPVWRQVAGRLGVDVHHEHSGQEVDDVARPRAEPGVGDVPREPDGEPGGSGGGLLSWLGGPDEPPDDGAAASGCGGEGAADDASAPPLPPATGPFYDPYP